MASDSTSDPWIATDLDQNTEILKLQEKSRLEQLKIKNEEEKTQLQMSAAFIVAEYVEARRDFLNSYENWLLKRKEIILELYQLSNELDKWRKGKDISQAAGSSMGLIGGSLTITGLVLLPVTMGASSTLCAVGLGVGLTGGVTSLSGTVGELLADKSKVKTAQNQMNLDIQNTAKIAKAYENLKLCLFEANFVLERCKESKKIIQDKLKDLEIQNSSFMPQGLIHTMKVEQINSALAATKINEEIERQKEIQKLQAKINSQKQNHENSGSNTPISGSETPDNKFLNFFKFRHNRGDDLAPLTSENHDENESPTVETKPIPTSKNAMPYKLKNEAADLKESEVDSSELQLLQPPPKITVSTTTSYNSEADSEKSEINNNSSSCSVTKLPLSRQMSPHSTSSTSSINFNTLNSKNTTAADKEMENFELQQELETAKNSNTGSTRIYVRVFRYIREIYWKIYMVGWSI